MVKNKTDVAENAKTDYFAKFKNVIGYVPKALDYVSETARVYVTKPVRKKVGYSELKKYLAQLQKDRDNKIHANVPSIADVGKAIDMVDYAREVLTGDIFHSYVSDYQEIKRIIKNPKDPDGKTPDIFAILGNPNGKSLADFKVAIDAYKVKLDADNAPKSVPKPKAKLNLGGGNKTN